MLIKQLKLKEPKICDEKINEYYAKGLALLDGVSLPAERKEELKSFVCRLMNRKV